MAARGRMSNGFNMDYKEREDFSSDRNSLESFRNQSRMNQRMNENSKLHVANIPMGMDERTLGSLFSAEGLIPERVFISRNKKNGQSNNFWGFVELKSVAEAQTAIASLHRKPPHDLVVQFAKADRPDGFKDKIPLERSQQGNMSQGGRGRGQFPMKDQLNDSFKSQFPNDDFEEFQEVSSSSRFSARSPVDHNTPNSRDKLPSLPIEKYAHVEMSDEMDLHVAAYISNRAKDLTIDDLSNLCSEIKLALPFKPGQCIYCQRAAIYTCSRCKSWYCSEFCRITHWPHHKDNCSPRSVVFQKDGTLTYKDIPDAFCNDSMKQKQPAVRGPKTGRSFGSDFRNDSFNNYNVSDKDTTESNRLENGTNHIHEKFNDNLDHRNSNNYSRARSDQGSRGGYRNMTRKDRPADRHGGGRVGGQQFLGTKSTPNKQNWTDELSCTTPPRDSYGAEQQKLHVDHLERCPVPANIFTEVTVGAVGNDGEFWAYKLDDYDKQAEMMSQLRDARLPGPPERNLEIGLKCVAPYQGDWFRAEIVKVFQDSVMVVFVDFGNPAEIKKQDLKMIPKHLESLPPLAHEFVLAESSGHLHLQEDLSLRIKPVSQDKQGRWVVMAEITQCHN